MPKRSEYSFNPRSRQLLKAAGWVSGRSVSTRPYAEAYDREGLALSPVSEAFLKNFGGLLIHYETASGQTDVLGLTADEAIRNMGRGILAQTEEEFAVGRLCPLGQYLWGMCLLLQADDGAVYGLLDDRRILVGASGNEAVDNILSLEEPTVLESDFLADIRNLAVQTKRDKKNDRK